jgi:hypothetical protein
MSPRTKEAGMHKFRRTVLTCATAATLLLALAAGTAGADPRANVCDVEALWGGFFAGSLPGNQGFVAFRIFDQAPPAPSDNDGSEAFALASQLATEVGLGLGNAFEGDKYHFRVETELTTNLATAQGHGFLFVSDMGMATFVVAGKGTHPLAGPEATSGWFKLSGEGNVTCVAEEGTAADADVHLEFQNGMTDDSTVGMARCPDQTNVEQCEGDLG